MSDQTQWRRNALTALGVLALHAGLIWSLHNALDAPVPELLVPVSLLVPNAERSDTPAPVERLAVPPAPSQAALQPVPPISPRSTAQPRTLSTKPEVAPPPSAATPTPLPSPAAGASTPAQAPAAAPAANSASNTPSSAATTPGAGPSTADVSALQLPSSDADYLRNPKPVYPPLSKRLNEQGLVIHSVLIGADGRPVSAKLVKSSGFDRLDKAAHEAVMQWRYVPGKRQGVPETMSFNVPIKWVLE